MQKKLTASKKIRQTNARKVEGCRKFDPLGVEDNTATRIICTEVLEHVPSTSQFLNELVQLVNQEQVFINRARPNQSVYKNAVGLQMVFPRTKSYSYY